MEQVSCFLLTRDSKKIIKRIFGKSAMMFDQVWLPSRNLQNKHFLYTVEASSLDHLRQIPTDNIIGMIPLTEYNIYKTYEPYFKF